MYEILHIGLQLSIKWNWQLLNIVTFHLGDNGYNRCQWIRNIIRFFFLICIRKWYVFIMEYLLKLAVIMTLLYISLLQLMHFNDLHLLFKCFTLLFDTGISKC